LVDLLLPDDVVGGFGALFANGVLDAFKDDAGISTGFFAYACLKGGGVAVSDFSALQELVSP